MFFRTFFFCLPLGCDMIVFSGLLLRDRAHLLHRHAAGALAGSGVRVSALTADREIAAMPAAPVTLEIDQSLDAELYVAAQIAFDAEVRFDRVTNLADVVLVEIVALPVGRDP